MRKAVKSLAMCLHIITLLVKIIILDWMCRKLSHLVLHEISEDSHVKIEQ